MKTQTIDRPRTAPDDGSSTDTPERFHYVRKDEIARSAVTGQHVVALCGEVFPVTRLPKPTNPVCDDCKRIYDRMSK